MPATNLMGRIQRIQVGSDSNVVLEVSSSNGMLTNIQFPDSIKREALAMAIAAYMSDHEVAIVFGATGGSILDTMQLVRP